MGTGQRLGGSAICLLLLFLLRWDTTEAAPEPQYLVLAPFLIHTETSEKICVQLSHLNESVTLSVTLEYGGENRSLFSDVKTAKDVFECVPFKIPKWNSPGAAEVFLTVLVKGATLRFWSRKTVLVKNVESLTFVQTDKPIYKPGQEVQFRIVSLDEDFHPVNEKFPTVYIEDPKRNRLAQWRDVQLDVGLVQLSFPLASEPALGTYKVVVQRASSIPFGNVIESYFTAEEYVLPKFEVTVKAPKRLTIMDDKLEVTCCGQYTFGKPVPGLFNISVCRPYNYRYGGQCYGKESEAVCEEFSVKPDARGCFSQVMKTKVFQLKRSGYRMNLDVECKITEEGTGVELRGTASTDITSTLSTITLQRMDRYYRQGLPIMGQLTLEDGTNRPITNATVEVRADSVNKYLVITDDHGQAQFSIDTDNFTGDAISIQVMARGSILLGQTHTVTLEHPRVVPSLQQGAVKILEHHIRSRSKGVFSLDLPLDCHYAPLARLLVYTILPRGEVVAHSADFNVENCFENKVKLEFDEPSSLPADDNHLHLSVSKPSLCAIHAVDKSVFLLKPEAELSPQTVYNLLPVKELRGYYHEGHSLTETNINPCVRGKKFIKDGIRYRPEPYSYNEGDSYGILQDFGLKVFTSTKMHKPEICPDHRPTPVAGHYYERYHATPISAGISEMSGSADSSPVVAVESEKPARKFFPETWLWKLQVVNEQKGGAKGEFQAQADIPVTVPDTITEWKAGAFCLSEEAGFGLASSVFVLAFQHFFIEITMPYSMVRGEATSLKATVFNYRDECFRIRTTLAPSDDFDASPVTPVEDSFCLCKEERKTLSWDVTPKTLGEVNVTVSAEALGSDLPCGNEVVVVPSKGSKDTVIKTLLVEPEGIEMDVAINSLLCADGNSHATPISLKLPENTVEGSARATHCVLGDILGGAIQNLQHLIKMPYGCGEQNMLLFAPNIYVMDYLNKTGQLTEQLRSTITGHLAAGYQKQLHYKHSDGSYSTFGQRGQETGITWLTAFVLKSFSQSRGSIFIEERHIAEALAALAIRQKGNGCFQSTGSLLNNALKGGVDDEISLSTYIAIALLEMPLPLTHSVVRNAMFCLETAAQAKEVDIYSQALLAYAFTLAGKEDKRQEALRNLEARAVKGDDGSLHWQRPVKPENGHSQFYEPRASSAEVEVTAYVLLAHVAKKPEPSQEDLMTSTNIVSWLSKQQNPNGGFSSTQDTVVALQALAKYAALIHSNTLAAAVALSSGDSKLHQFNVDSTNRLLLQCHELPNVPGDYKAEVTGQGCVYLQTALKYNVLPHHEDAPFELDVHTVPETCTGAKAERMFQIAINVSYTGKRHVSNMVIVDAKMLSGHFPVKSSVKKLEHQAHIERTEVTAGHVLLYLDRVTNVTQSFTFTVERDVLVQGLKAATVKIYDYYETDDYAIDTYNAPCSTGATKHVKG